MLRGSRTPLINQPRHPQETDRFYWTQRQCNIPVKNRQLSSLEPFDLSDFPGERGRTSRKRCSTQ
ncbi:MAG: hypothetical protein GX575_23525 [Candidatus Anammoximicrobium sp.]|nr:hypothetical protein [Candidatus Anammoximicrobium sp.]